MSHNLARLPDKFAPLAAILENFRGVRTDVDQFVGELLDRLDHAQRGQTDTHSQFAEERDRLHATITQLQQELVQLQQEFAQRLKSSDAQKHDSEKLDRLREELSQLRKDATKKEALLRDLVSEGEAIRDDRDRLQTVVSQLEGQSSDAKTIANQAQQLQQQLDASHREITNLHEQLNVAASTPDSDTLAQLEQLTRQKQEMQMELDAVRFRAVELGEKLRETERLAAEERTEWTAELRQMRKLLEKPAVAAPVPAQAPPSSATPMVTMPAAAAATPADAVLTNVMAQFELVQQDVQRHRSAG